MEISVGNKYFLFKITKSGLSMIRTENRDKVLLSYAS